MNKIFKIGIPLISLLGIITMYIFDNKNIGTLILFFYTPLLLIYSVLMFIKESNSTKLKFRKIFVALIITSLIITLLYLISIFFGSIFSGILKISGIYLSIINLIFSVIYFSVNNKSITSNFTYELVVLLFPSIIFIWSVVPYNLPPQLSEDYMKLISISNQNLEKNNKILIENNMNLNSLKELNDIKNFKNELIKLSGGYIVKNGQKSLASFYDKSAYYEVQNNLKLLQKLNINQKLKKMILEVKISGDAVFILTQIENEIILNSCNN